MSVTGVYSINDDDYIGSIRFNHDQDESESVDMNKNPETKKDYELMHKEANELEKKEEEDIMDLIPEDNPWGIKLKSKGPLANELSLFSTKHGLYSTIPLVCQGEDCIYAHVDPLHKSGMYEKGERCLTEIAFILTKYNAYKEELGIGDKDAVDQSLMRDLIDYDVQILRAETKMAFDGDFVKDVTVGIADNGKEIMQEQISQAAQYKDKVQEKRNRTLQLLASTRKDKKAEDMADKMDPSSYASMLMKQAEKIKGEEAEEILEAEYEEFDNLEVVPDVTYELPEEESKGEE